MAANNPVWEFGQAASDMTGNPNVYSYAQEAHVRSAGKIVDDEITRRVDADLAARYPDGLESASAAAWDAEVEARLALEALPGVSWDDVAQDLYGMSWDDLARSPAHRVADRVRVTDEAKLRRETPERIAARARVAEAEAAGAELRTVAATTYRRHALDVMDEIRPMADGHKDSFRWTTTPKQGRSATKAKATLDSASRFYPQAWVDRINANRTIRTGVIERGHEADYRSHLEIMLSGKRRGALLPDDPDMLAVAIHELAHGMESMDLRIRALEHAFHHRRTTDFDTVERVLTTSSGGKINLPKQEATSAIDGRKTERGRKDKWADHYSGRVYEGGGPSQYWEHLSTGMEGLFTGRYGMDLDADYRHFVLGILSLL